jgi:DNA-binding CsgD family transcriptional regulator
MSGLSPRQLQVLRLIADGRSVQGIADTLHVGHATASKVKGQVFAALGAVNGAQAVHLAHRRGILTDPADAEAVALVRQAQAMGYRLALVPLEESR